MNESYEQLPDCIKSVYSEKEWLWLPQSQKMNLVEDECMPEVEED